MTNKKNLIHIIYEAERDGYSPISNSSYLWKPWKKESGEISTKFFLYESLNNLILLAGENIGRRWRVESLDNREDLKLRTNNEKLKELYQGYLDIIAINPEESNVSWHTSQYRDCLTESGRDYTGKCSIVLTPIKNVEITTDPRPLLTQFIISERLPKDTRAYLHKATEHEFKKPLYCEGTSNTMYGDPFFPVNSLLGWDKYEDHGCFLSQEKIKALMKQERII